MFEENNDEKKLDWMYKGASSTVDREEYLLGRSVDKSLDQLNASEKSGGDARHPKNHVEHECIPPSIRDFKNLTSGEQVDLQQKLQEDPLVAIKKQEEETRRRLLQNPVQLKKLQDVLKSKEKKKKKKRKESSEDELDSKLAEKYLKLKAHLGIDDLKKEKKKRRKSDLDDMLLDKLKKLKNKMNLDDIMNMSVSSEDSDESGKKSRKKKRKKKKKSKRESSSSSSSDDEDEKKEHRKKVEVQQKSLDDSKRRKDDDFQRKRTTNYDQKSPRNRSPERSYRRNEPSRRRTRTPERISSRERNDTKPKQRNRSGTPPKPAEKRKPKSPEKSSSSDSSSSSGTSDEERMKRKKVNYGLVKADGSKIALNRNKHEDKSSTIVKPKEIEKKYEKPKYKKLSEDEKDKLRREMMDNAKWRDKERVNNVKRYRREDEKEVREQDYNPEFLTDQLIKSAKNSTVESRIKSNINNIQRSSRDMNAHFSRRY